MDFVAQRLARHPDLHIYHYAACENTALKRLMSLHGTREDAVDRLRSVTSSVLRAMDLLTPISS